MEGAENATTEVIDNQAAVLTPEQVAWKQQMDAQFNTDQSHAPQPPAATTDENTETNIAAAQELQQPDYTPFIKEFGVETVGEFKTQWQELQALKANPPQAQEIEFANEDSKKLNELIRKGDLKGANAILSQHLELDELATADVTEDTADKIIKAGMRFENKDLTQQEIDFKFRKMFAIPKEPVLDADDEDSVARHNEWKEQVEDIKMSKTIEAKMMKPKLAAAKSTIKFPDIEIQSNVDADYEAYKASKANVLEVANNELIPAIRSLKEGDVQLGFKVNDANNQMEFDVALAPTPEAFEKAKQDSLSFDTWIQSVCYDETGKFHPERVQKLILLYNNYDNYAQSIARQAVNAERKMVIAKETGNQNTGGRNYNVNVGERTELQKQMDARLS